MAIRNIVQEGDDVLRSKCRPVTEFNEHLWQLLDDMADTLKKADGVGLAGPQVGILRRLFIMNFGDKVIEAMNPEIILREGKQEEVEGCLSLPGKYGITRRPQRVKLKAQDRNGKYFIMSGEDLVARCICHENDHLDGVLFTDHVVRMVED